MQVGMIGLGRMGMNMTRRLQKGGHEVVVYNRTREKINEIEKEGAIGSSSLEEFIKKLKRQRVVWLMLPSGDVVEQHINLLSELLEEGDIIIEGGNSNFKDDLRRFNLLKDRMINYLDAGVSGGIWGLKSGYCIMIGGQRDVYEKIEPLLKTLAPEDGYLYCGPSGAGHFVKMVHNGIEYAMMEAYGEGFELLERSPYREYLNYRDLAHLWNQGSVIKSWLLELLENVFDNDPRLSKVEGYVEDSGEGRWSVIQAVESGTPLTSIAHALFKRFQSRDNNLFSDRLQAALRNEFGGHKIKKKRV